MYIVRRRISLPSEKAMFLFVNKVLPTTRWVNCLYNFILYMYMHIDWMVSLRVMHILLQLPSLSLSPLPPSSASMGSIYAEHKDEDGFLYVAYSGENTFGQ